MTVFPYAHLDNAVIFYFLFKFLKFLSGLFGAVLVQESGRAQKTWMGELCLLHRYWFPETGLSSLGLPVQMFPMLFGKCGVKSCIGITLSRPEM